MTFDEFSFIMGGLADTFGAKTAGTAFERRVERFYRRFSRYDSVTIQAGFDAAEDSEERFPSLSRLLEYVRIEAARRPSGAQKATPCFTCDGSGVVKAEDNLGYKAVFLCPDCDNGHFNYPRWSRGWEARGWSRYLPVGWDDKDDFQARGLALLGPESLPWKSAPAGVVARARKILDEGFRPKDGTIGAALRSRPDPQKEAERRRHVEQVERNAESEDFCPF